MSCCGSRRRALAAPLPALARAPAPRPAPAPRFLYLGTVERALRGPASGRLYRVEPGGTIESEPGDARALLATGLFRPA